MQNSKSVVSLMVFAAGVALSTSVQAGSLTIVEPGWTVIREVSFNNPASAVINPLDGRIYTGQRASGTEGLWRIDSLGFATELAPGAATTGLLIDPVTGHIFVSEDNSGNIYRTEFNTTGRTTWVSGFHSGDDDPTGMAIAPPGYAGNVVLPGDALVVDRGVNGPTGVWLWSTVTAQGEVELAATGTMTAPGDITIDENGIFITDSVNDLDGIIWELGVGGTLTPFATSEPLANPVGITIDPLNGDLVVLDDVAQRVVRINRATGSVTNIITNFDAGTNSFSGVEFTADGRQLVITSNGADMIYVIARCTPERGQGEDCNNNGIADFCEIAMGDVPDCNGNGVPDSCDIASGFSNDCNNDGIPDECAACPAVEVVFIMDTSSSMDGEAAALCNGIQQVTSNLAAAGLTVNARYLGICDQPGGAFSCLENHVSALLGTVVPGNPPADQQVLGSCPGGNEVCSEDWARAVSVVAGSYNWLPLTQSVRLIIPLSDEGPWCGDPVNTNDDASITHAIAVAQANNVIVSPITGSGSSAAMIALAQQLASATGGQQFASTEPSFDIADSIVNLVLSACASSSDCNRNGIIDSCDIIEGRSLDENGNGVPDECEIVQGDLDDDGDVDIDDRSELCAILGSGVGDPGFDVAGDLNHDNVINHLDLGLFNKLQPACIGDIVESSTFMFPPDGLVDGADLAFLLGAWGIGPSCADLVTSKTFLPPPDGIVDGADLAVLLGAWGACP